MQDKITNKPNAVRGFSRFAHIYDHYNMIQESVAKLLVSKLEQKHYSMIMDVGCGSGAVVKNLQVQSISFEKFIAIDLSEEMLAIHPSSDRIMKCCMDFNAPEGFHVLCGREDTLVLSSSALQWSRDLDLTLSQLSKCGEKAYFAIFTAGTFKTLHECAGICSPIYSEKEMREKISKYYEASFTSQSYQLTFENTKEMFRYIQKSGVSGGKRQLGYKAMKRVMEAYPWDYLEFEVLFVEATPRR